MVGWGGWLKDMAAAASLVARGIIIGEREVPNPGGRGGGWLGRLEAPMSWMREMKCLFC